MDFMNLLTSINFSPIFQLGNTYKRKSRLVGADGLEPSTCPIYRTALTNLNIVGAPGLEPGASVLSGLRSNQLSYAPVLP